ncbi:MAG TPA: metalloregulator ArsR/SmtB family transcription factor [Dissulfurispiraceae bacterium]|nr:metalloregulator ArsR/SmtB family transcription factor [Dissulfurispiraceae bacterium]
MQEILTIFKALSDETRLRILKLLEHGELCVCDIFSALDMIQPKVSFHLSVLKEARLIKDRKAGRWVHYSLDDSDVLRRFLLHTVIERVSEEVIRGDRERLKSFLESKEKTAGRCAPVEEPARKSKAVSGCRCPR